MKNEDLAPCILYPDGSVQGDWRLPNVRELHSLLDFGEYNPPLTAGHPFSEVQLGGYWSSTTYASVPERAWIVSMNAGAMDHSDGKDFNFYLLPVRDKLEEE